MQQNKKNSHTVLVPARGIAALHACDTCALHAFYTHITCTKIISTDHANMCNESKTTCSRSTELINCL